MAENLTPVNQCATIPAGQPAARNDFLDYLKGALIFLVVCGHLIQFVGYADGPGYYLDPLFKAIYTFHMPLFMAVSGFVSFRFISKMDFLPAVQKRTSQLVIPAVCWPALYLLAQFVACLFQHGTPGGGWHSFLKSLAAFRPGLWFLWAVFGSTVVVCGLKKFHRDRLGFFAAATLGLLVFAPDGADIYLFKYTFSFFWLGYALAKGDQIRVPKIFPAAWLALIFFASIICYRLWTTDTYVYTTRMQLGAANLPNLALRYFAGAVVSAAFALLLFGCYRLKKSATLSGWGRRSLDIYIIHAYFVSALAAVENPLKHSLWFSFLAAPALAAILCLACFQIGRGLSRIPIASTLLLGQPQNEVKHS